MKCIRLQIIIIIIVLFYKLRSMLLKTILCMQQSHMQDMEHEGYFSSHDQNYMYEGFLYVYIHVAVFHVWKVFICVHVAL